MVLATTRSIGLGMMGVVQQTDDILVARGLGSCIGITVYDRTRKIAAMAHVMLPGPAPEKIDEEQPARYAEPAVIELIRAVEKRGGRRTDLVVKIAGGAQVIKLYNKDDRLQVGRRNIQAVQEAAARHGLIIRGEHTGGTVGRTLYLYAATGEATVRLVGGEEKPL